jgi:hypothetical protein
LIFGSPKKGKKKRVVKSKTSRDGALVMVSKDELLLTQISAAVEQDGTSGESKKGKSSEVVGL